MSTVPWRRTMAKQDQQFQRPISALNVYYSSSYQQKYSYFGHFQGIKLSFVSVSVCWSHLAIRRNSIVFILAVEQCSNSLSKKTQVHVGYDPISQHVFCELGEGIKMKLPDYRLIYVHMLIYGRGPQVSHGQGKGARLLLPLMQHSLK